MTSPEDMKSIAENITDEDALMQLAEEAAELAQAALKLIRARSQRNPTPVTEREALESLAEEYGDVQLCMDVVQAKIDYRFDIMATLSAGTKSRRWSRRLKERNA